MIFYRNKYPPPKTYCQSKHFRIQIILWICVQSLEPAFAQLIPPSFVSPQEETNPEQKGTLILTAVFAPDSEPIQSGVHWRIFKSIPENSQYPLVLETQEAAPILSLPAGTYLIHVSFGLAGSIKRVQVKTSPVTEQFVLNAGALKITGMLGNSPIPPYRMAISIFVPEPGNSEAKLVLGHSPAGELIGLPEGVYHISSIYLDVKSNAPLNPEDIAENITNSVASGDIRISAGKMVEATMRHRAATITLKLVNKQGGEALANTTFTVLTPGGDVIKELMGAFPSIVLAEGEYIAIARKDEKTYQSVFKVQTRVDQEVEILMQEGS